MAEYPEFKHGTRGEVNAEGLPLSGQGRTKQAFVYIGTAPVNQVEGGAANVNKPILVRNMADARRYLGYSDDWAKYTLCEAMHVHFEQKNVGPLVFINVLDPKEHRVMESNTEYWIPEDGEYALHYKASWIDLDSIAVDQKTRGTDYTVEVDESTGVVFIRETSEGSMGTGSPAITYDKAKDNSAYKTAENGRVRILNAEDAILDSLEVKKGVHMLDKDEDYTATYNVAKKAIDIVEKVKGTFGTDQLTITYAKVNPAAVTTADVIGNTDGYGLNTGVYAVKNVYNATGYIPAYILAPGFSSVPTVHQAMVENSTQISKHWFAWMFVDMPLVDSLGAAITLQTAPTWKAANGYNQDNESVFFPMAKGTDGRKYHLSVLNAANFQELMIQNDGIPYMTGSNTEVKIVEDLYFTEAVTGRVYDDEVINRCLNANGINSAAYVGGRWVIWGMFAGSYNQEDGTTINVNDTCLMMLYYLTNDFQHRRNVDIDKPMPINALKSIVAEEQSRVDALLGIGALTYGKVMLDASKEARSDVYSGDFRILFNVTNTPLAKSLTAIARWVADGFEVYFAAMDGVA